MSNTKLKPSTDLTKRIAAIFHRRPDTCWNQYEIKAFKDRFRDGCFKHEQDLLNLERYYKAHWPPENDQNKLRHDLKTLLNNFQGEVDRANIYCERHPIRSKIIPMPPAPSEPFALDPADAPALERFNQARALRKKQQ